LGNNNNN